MAVKVNIQPQVDTINEHIDRLLEPVDQDKTLIQLETALEMKVNKDSIVTDIVDPMNAII